MISPLVTVIVPCFNSEAYIRNALESIQLQSYENFECIVIDDCSSDSTGTIVEDFIKSDSRFKLHLLNKNTGSPSIPRNIGCELASGSYLAFLDSDDVWHKDKLRVQIAIMQDFSAKISCTAYSIKDHYGRKLGAVSPKGCIGFNDLLEKNEIGLSTAIVSSEIFKKFRFLSLGHEDYAYWLQITSNGYYVLGINQLLCTHLRRPNSISSNKLIVIFYYWKIFRQVLKFSILKSIFKLSKFGLRRILRRIKFGY
jgi:teichuronic acid biosynthesis glycosyltransferase TuaG